MSIRDYKITDAQIKEKGVIASPDTLNGTAAENKSVFDRLTREIVAPQFNAIVDTFADMEETTHIWSSQEDNRQLAEADRGLAEAQRRRAEADRVAAETARAQAEAARTEAENKRRQSASEMSQLHSSVIAHENERIAWESGREEAENQRQQAETARAEAETARAEAETARAQAEAARTQVETARVEAEKARAEAESKRVQDASAMNQMGAALKANEADRVAQENARRIAENQRQEAEDARDGAENDRMEAEQGRIGEEEYRASLEKERVRFENGRKRNEDGRVLAETARVEAETARSQAETERKQAEAARAEAESERDDAENYRMNAEQERADEEENRVHSESARVRAENQRIQAENERQSLKKSLEQLEGKLETAEDKRVQAEAGRVLAETTRAEAETARVEAEKARAAKDAERDGKIGAIADGLQTTQQTVAALADRLDVLDVLFKFPRTGKVYTVKIPKFATNQTTVCEKLDDNVGLVCEPSTDTVEGQDDYADIPLFRWYNCNYLRDSKGHAYPTAIEGISEDYATTGTVDVGVIQMAPYIKWEDTDDYNILSITDTPREGYRLWCEAASDGKDYPYVIHSKYFSGIAEDGLPRSQPNLTPDLLNSYLNMIDKYFKKGDGYFGAREARNTWQIIFTLIKYSAKSSQTVFAGCVDYNRQYSASIQREDKLTYFPLTKAQADGILVGSCVSVGYGSNNNGAINNDRNISTVHKYADAVRVLRIEALDDANAAVYLDIEDGFNTVPIALTDTLSAPITLSTMPWHSGSTDAVIGHHDGSPTSNTNGLYPYRVQGVEYAVGGYFLASDIIMDIQSDCSKNVLCAPPEAKRLTDSAQAVKNYRLIGNIPGNAGTDYWIGDIALDIDSGVSYPCSIGSGDRTGVGDRAWIGGTSTAGQREYLRGGFLWTGFSAGSSFLSCRGGLNGAFWYGLAAD